MRFRVIWIFFERGFSFAEGGFVIACAMQDVAQLGMRFRKVGVQTQDLLIGLDGCGEVLLLAQENAQDEIRFRRFGPAANVGVQFVFRLAKLFVANGFSGVGEMLECCGFGGGRRRIRGAGGDGFGNVECLQDQRVGAGGGQQRAVGIVGTKIEATRLDLQGDGFGERLARD